LKPKKIVLIGGPATGKTTLIEALKARGYQCMEEISRQITIEAQKNGVKQLFLEDPIWFSQQLLEKRKKQFFESEVLDEDVVFFDRGLPDVWETIYSCMRKSQIRSSFYSSSMEKNT